MMEKQDIPERNDPVALWKRATVNEERKFIGFPRPDSSLISKPKELFARRPVVLTSLSQMTPDKQVSFMKKLVYNWPFKAEKRALTWPLHGGVVANSITSTIIGAFSFFFKLHSFMDINFLLQYLAFLAARINAEIFLCKSNTPFLDSLKQCPRVPCVMAIYASGVAFFAMYTVFIQSIVLKLVVTNQFVICERKFFSFFVDALLNIRFIIEIRDTWLLKSGEKKFPLVRNYIDFLTLSFIGARAATPLLSRLVILQSIIAFLSTTAVIWGRNKLFATAEVDPELVKEIMVKGEERSSAKQWIQGKLEKTPIIGTLVEDPTEEK
uniref:Reticulon-like protein n=1 Tax=Syphacia muris TaxID=451379 RepID=A0A0N5ABK6_9BILA